MLAIWLTLLYFVAALAVESQTVLEAYPKITVRLAQPSDARTMAEVLFEAFADSPHIKYCYQFADNPKYVEIALQCATESLEDSLSKNNHFGHLGILHTARGHKVVSASGWTSPLLSEYDNDAIVETRDCLSAFLAPRTSMSGLDCPGPAINLTRANHFSGQLEQAEKRLLIDVYGKRQLYLAAIGTLPQYQGHDIAGELLREGLAHGTNLTKHLLNDGGPLHATLTATPAGEPLYLQNQYLSIENISMSTLEGEYLVQMDVMERRLR